MLPVTRDQLLGNFCLSAFYSYLVFFCKITYKNKINTHYLSKLIKIISSGHRNPAGLFLDSKTNNLYESEFGAEGGDEINIIGFSPYRDAHGRGKTKKLARVALKAAIRGDKDGDCHHNGVFKKAAKIGIPIRDINGCVLYS